MANPMFTWSNKFSSITGSRVKYVYLLAPRFTVGAGSSIRLGFPKRNGNNWYYFNANLFCRYYLTKSRVSLYPQLTTGYANESGYFGLHAWRNTFWIGSNISLSNRHTLEINFAPLFFDLGRAYKNNRNYNDREYMTGFDFDQMYIGLSYHF